MDLYEKDYDPDYPVVCVDEKPCQILTDVVEPLPMGDGRVKRYDYTYKRNGTCNVFIAFEPLSGRRFVEVRRYRRRNDYAHFMKALDKKYPGAKLIRVVQDNLNTHSAGSFYETFCAKEAFALKERFEFHYTPKHASWLNIAEIELSVLSRQCLRRRFSGQDVLDSELSVLVEERNRIEAKVHWEFSKDKAREVFKKYYIS